MYIKEVHWRPSLLKVQRVAALSIRSFPLSAAKKVLNVTVQQRLTNTNVFVYIYTNTCVRGKKFRRGPLSRRTICRESLKITNFRLKYLRN